MVKKAEYYELLGKQTKPETLLQVNCEFTFCIQHAALIPLNQLEQNYKTYRQEWSG